MTNGPFPGHGRDGEEPEGSGPLPAGGNGPRDISQGPREEKVPGRDGSRGGHSNPPEDGFGEEWPLEEGSEQGLFWCVPAGAPDLAGFAGDAGEPVIAPGPLLAGLTAAVAGGDGAGL
ncbi:MAG: hypothetical protein ABSB76_38310, partial [Streptosporangiaceae bacterium]